MHSRRVVMRPLSLGRRVALMGLGITFLCPASNSGSYLRDTLRYTYLQEAEPILRLHMLHHLHAEGEVRPVCPPEPPQDLRRRH
eukprot:2857769-Pyramimonas_sp.AAC.2